MDRKTEEEIEQVREKVHREVQDEILDEYLKDKRHERLWKTVRRTFIAVAFVGGIFLYAGILAGSLGYRTMPLSETVAVVPIEGPIANYTTASAESVITVLDKMFDSDAIVGIVLYIDSGGGSPGEAERIYKFIESKKRETDKEIYAVCANMCASAAYMIAIHTDGVYAGEYSWVGSIGAVMKGWDLDDAMSRFDVGQRVFASGPLKDMLNPYTALSERGAQKAEELVNRTAGIFIDDVKARRGDGLSNDKDLYTGEVWTGPDSKALGLIDEIATLEEVVRQRFPDQVTATYRPKDRGNTLFDTLLGNFAKALAAQLKSAEMRIEM